MKRNCSLSEISDGNLYEGDDLVRVSCNGCKGEALCCHGMGTSIILDPFDLYQLMVNLKITFVELLKDKIELNIADGIILPNLKMTGVAEGCAFLNEKGRCSIHSVRPGICRIFPLGRYYEDYTFKYFLQINECRNNSQTKVKVNKWIDTPNSRDNEEFLIEWHYFLNEVEDIIKKAQDEKMVKNINMYLLNNFYIKSYEANISFYEQFKERIREAGKLLMGNQ